MLVMFQDLKGKRPEEIPPDLKRDIEEVTE
jgi:hypothetical protein